MAPLRSARIQTALQQNRSPPVKAQTVPSGRASLYCPPQRPMQAPPAASAALGPHANPGRLPSLTNALKDGLQQRECDDGKNQKNPEHVLPFIACLSIRRDAFEFPPH